MDLAKATLVAAVIAIVGTTFGWFANLIVQLAVALVQADRQHELDTKVALLTNEFQNVREKRTYLLPNQLDSLDETLLWLENGLDIVIRYVAWLDSPAAKILSKIPGIKAKPGRLIEKEHVWRIRSARLIMLAADLDGLYGDHSGADDPSESERKLHELMHDFLVAINEITNPPPNKPAMTDLDSLNKPLRLQELIVNRIQLVRRWLIESN